MLSFGAALPIALAHPTPVAPAVPSQCGGSSWTLLVNGAVMNIKNDEDAGPGSWYWALDNYKKSIFIWQSDTTPTDFCTLVQYSGKWHTFAGALTPGNPANSPTTVEPHDGGGKESAAYVATFASNGPFNPNNVATTGNLGNFNFGGTKADILLGTAGTGDTTYTSFIGMYFGNGYVGGSFTYQAATYVYTQGNGLGYGNFWVSSPISNNANIGDIITK